jgi:hypothetical protein
MCDVIELGDDGAFEMPMPPPSAKGSGVAGNVNDPENAAGSENDPYLEDAAANALKGVAAISPGGYKIYDEHDARALSIVVRFETEEERVKGCRVSSAQVEVTTSAGTTMTVPLVNAVKPGSATCTTAENVVVIRVNKA